MSGNSYEFTIDIKKGNNGNNKIKTHHRTQHKSQNSGGRTRNLSVLMNEMLNIKKSSFFISKKIDYIPNGILYNNILCILIHTI